MTEREANRDWLTGGANLRPDGWEAQVIATYGIEGALDVLAVQGGDMTTANMSRRPFSRDPELKAAIYEAREATWAAIRLAYARMFEDTR